MQSAPHRRPKGTDGFTLIEVLVASVLLIIGVLATLALLDTGAKATAVSKQRDVANALSQEMIERAQGGRYTVANNDMTDVDPQSSTPGPADRMRAALDPDGDGASTAVAPATVVSGSIPVNVPQSWSVRRKNTTYTVSYSACTLSDTYQGVQIAGPYDCTNPATTRGGGGNEATSGDCSIGVIPPDPNHPTPLTVNLQVLGVTGLNVCLGALVPGLSDLTKAVCTLVGNSNLLTGITGTGGSLSSLLGGLANSHVTADLCPSTQVAQSLLGALPGIGSATRLEVTVTWNGFDGRKHTAAQAAVVRRAVA